MVRTQIQLDEDTYGEIKRLAYTKGMSMSAVVRELIDKSLGKKKSASSKKSGPQLSDFTFIGSLVEGREDNVSERHDEVLGEGEW